MRTLRTLALLPLILLSLLSATPAVAESLYQVEVIVFRQNAEQLFTARPAPDDWAQGAQPVSADIERATTLDTEASKLNPGNGYQVLLHKAWAQPISATPGSMALSTGDEQFGHFPVEGTLTLKQDGLIDLDANLWINQFDESGLLNSSELFKHSIRLQNGELTFLDHGSLGMLVRIRSL